MIGTIFSTLGAGLNTLFSMRSPSITITGLVALLIAYPIGNFWGAVMPHRTFKTFGLVWELNPGRLTIKEHTLIGIMTGVSFSVA